MVIRPVQGLAHDDFLTTCAVRTGMLQDGRLPSNLYARVTNIEDPEKLGRVKVKFYFLHEDGMSEMETDWVTREGWGMGPTKMGRKRVFGFNPPHPEVGSMVTVKCMTGDPHDLILCGQPEYLQGELGVPPTDKDSKTDWCLRYEAQNGFSILLDTEGNLAVTVPGNFRLKILGSGFISARGVLTLFGAMFRALSFGVLRLLGGRIDAMPFKTPEESALLREMSIDAMSAPAGRSDPGIGKVDDLT